jgi:hypothetical protein
LIGITEMTELIEMISVLLAAFIAFKNLPKHDRQINGTTN